MKLFRYIWAILFCLISNIVWSQNTDIRQYMEQVGNDFYDYSDRLRQSYNEYRDQINAEFANYMRQKWPGYISRQAEPLPQSPEPPKPVIKDPDAESTSDLVPFQELEPRSEPVSIDPPRPVVTRPRSFPVEPIAHQFHYSFYGTQCALSLTSEHRFRLSGIDENSVADAWLQLSSDKYNAVIAECLEWRDKLHLPDWGYVRFVEKMTEAFFNADSMNEARLLQMYILTQSGYKVRIARAGNNLVLLLPSKENIYQYPYLIVNNVRYYIVDKRAGQASYRVFDKEFPHEQYFSLQMTEKPKLSVINSSPRTLTSKRYPNASATIVTNRNLADFYNDYPMTDSWGVYVRSSLSEDAKKQLYPNLESAIDGKNKLDAANILLNFVQTAFEYKTDNDQFGYERPLFADETLYYPYCDCEDRAILFAILVRELLGLDVILLYYPNHLATAVCFDADVYGDYMIIDGKRYVICDPTYINADVGQAMPQFKQTKAIVERMDISR